MAALTDHLAWPAVVFIGLIVFRSQVSDIGARIGTLLDDNVEEASIGRQGFRIKRKLESDLQEARTLLSPRGDTVIAPRPDSRFLDEIDTLAAVAPAAAIAHASGRLEVALADVLANRTDVRRLRGLGGLMRACADNGLLTPNEAKAGKYLVDVRNEAVRKAVSTPDQAQDYARLALRIATAARLADGQSSLDSGDPL